MEDSRRVEASSSWRDSNQSGSVGRVEGHIQPNPIRRSRDAGEGLMPGSSDQDFLFSGNMFS